jgi:hypothetical protein
MSVADKDGSGDFVNWFVTTERWRLISDLVLTSLFLDIVV